MPATNLPQHSSTCVPLWLPAHNMLHSWASCPKMLLGHHGVYALSASQLLPVCTARPHHMAPHRDKAQQHKALNRTAHCLSATMPLQRPRSIDTTHHPCAHNTVNAMQHCIKTPQRAALLSADDHYWAQAAVTCASGCQQLRSKLHARPDFRGAAAAAAANRLTTT